MRSRPVSGIARLHRWAGRLSAGLFAWWFVSGVGMVFVRFPEVSREEALAVAAPLEATAELAHELLACLEQEPTARCELEHVGAGNVLRLLKGTVSRERRLDTPGAGQGELEVIARNWLGPGARQREVLADADLWNPRARERGTLPHVRYADEQGTWLDLAAATGCVVQKTTPRQRWTAWLGPIPHWLYAPWLRRLDWPWRALIYGTAGFGTVTALSGLLTGAARTLGAMRKGRFTPFARPLHRWHHVLGLLIGGLVSSWVLSGLLSLYPLGARTAPTPSAESLRLLELRATALPPLEPLLACLRSCAGSGGQRFTVHGVLDRVYATCTSRAGTRIQRIGTGLGWQEALGEADWLPIVAALAGTAAKAHPVHPTDPYAPAPSGTRVRFASARALHYVDTRELRLVAEYTPEARWQRWLYQGLHTWDLPGLAARPRVRRALVLLGCSGGLLFTLTGLGLLRTRSQGRRRRGRCPSTTRHSNSAAAWPPRSSRPGR